MKNIRCSMLPSWPDCNRRTAAKQYRKMIEAAGFPLRKLKASIGAAIGTAVHKFAAGMLGQKLDGLALENTLPSSADGLKDFMAEIAGGVEWDDTTPNLQTAYKQIESLAGAYRPLIKDVDPVLVEQDFKATIAEGWQLTGKIDLFDSAGYLDDLKTGSVARPYIQQAGGYVLLLEANGHEVKAAGNTFIKRVRPTKPQPAPKHTEFDLDSARRSAFATIQDIRDGVEAFEQSGDPYAFAANPMSMMCTEKYCPAWGTDFCTLHLKGE